MLRHWPELPTMRQKSAVQVPLQTLLRDNLLNAANSGCRVRGARDSGLTFSDKDVEFGNYQIPENWDQEAVVHALTKVFIRLQLQIETLHS